MKTLHYLLPQTQALINLMGINNNGTDLSLTEHILQAYYGHFIGTNYIVKNISCANRRKLIHVTYKN